MDKLLIALMIAGGIGMYMFREYIDKRPRRRRETALRQLALRIGLTYERDKNPFGQVPPLDQRVMGVLPQLARAFYGYPHVLRGESAAGPCLIFDIWHGNGGNSASRPYKLTLVAFHLGDVELPEFSIYPEGRAQKLGDSLFKFYTETIGRSVRDLDFDSHPVFSDRFTLRGKKEEATRALFQPELIAFWESLPVEERWSAAGAGKSLVVYRSAPWTAGREQEIPPDGIEAFLRTAETIAAAFRSSRA